jgi:hypothetical protein
LCKLWDGRHFGRYAASVAQKSAQQFDAAFAQVYQHPTVARRGYDRLVEERGPTVASALLRDTPERLGALQTVEQQRAFGLYTAIDTTAARAQAREAAGLAMQSHQAQARAATLIDLRAAL